MNHPYIVAALFVGLFIVVLFLAVCLVTIAAVRIDTFIWWWQNERKILRRRQKMKKEQLLESLERAYKYSIGKKSVDLIAYTKIKKIIMTHNKGNATRKYKRSKFIKQDLISIHNILKRIIFKYDAKPKDREEALRLLVRVGKALNIKLDRGQIFNWEGEK